MPTNINFNKKLGIIGGPGITLPTSSTPPPFSNVNSFSFDGVDDTLFSTSNYTELNGTQNFSISFWIKPIGTNTNGVWEILTQGNSERLTCIYRGVNERIEVQFRSQSYYHTTINNSVVPNQWSHIVYTYNGALGRYDRPELYVNGVLSQGVSSGVPYSSSNFNGTLTFGDSVFYTHGNNYIDEFSVWNNTTLTESQANELYNGGTPSDLNNIASGLTSPTTWLRMGDTATWNGFTWTMTDVNGGLVTRGANMVEANRTTDVPTIFSNTKSIALDGIDDFVDIGNPNNLSTITSISISAWFKTTDTVGGLVIVGSDDNAQGRRYILRTENSSGIKLRFFSFSSNNSFNDIIGTTNINDGQWHHVLAINNGTNLKIYVDGVLDNSNTNGNLINTTFATPDINIGRRSYSGVEGYFDGSIDEVAIWSSDQSANASAIGSTIPTDLSTYNPLGWWRCGDNDTAPTLTDNGSGGNDGTMNNFTTFSTDVPTFSNTQSILLDGVDDYVEIGSPTSIQSLTSEITISVWVKAPKTFSTQQYTLASKGEYGAAGGQWTIQMYTANASNTNGGYFQIFPQSNGITDRQALTFPTAIDDNQWHHLMCVNDGTDLKIYLDGQLEATGVGKGRTLYNGNRTLRLGRLTASSVNKLIGNLDEIAIFGTALGLSDAQTIYNNGIPNNISSLSPVSWWRFEGSGTTATDSGSGGNNGTLTNGVTRSTDVPLFNTKSIALDGVDDKVTFSDITASGAFTISFWIKPTVFLSNGGSFVFGTETGNANFFRLKDASSVQINIGGSLGGYNNGGSGNDFVLNQWQNVALVRNSNSDVVVYVNGVAWTNGVNNSNTLTINSIGRIINTSFGYSGHIDEFAFWNSDQSANLSDIGGTIPTDLSSYSPLHWYRCGDGDTAPILSDNGSGGNDGTMTNFSTFSTDVPTIPFSTRSIALDGVDDYVSVANNTTIARTQTISYSIWVNLVDGSARQYIIGNQTSSNGGTGLSIESGGFLLFQVADGTNDSYFNSKVTNFTTYAPNNTWNHILATFDGANAKIFINGILRNNWSVTTPYTISNYSNFWIGRRNANTSQLTNGKLDEIALFNTDQSANASTIYNGGVPNDISSLSPVSWWRCGDNDTAPTLTDNGSASNDGTMTNFTTFSTDVPT